MSPESLPIAVNARVLAHELTGVQRYTGEILRHLPQLDVIAPAQWVSGPRGHAWEQMALPAKLGRRLLWSPSNTGPLAVRRQVVTCHDISPFDDQTSVGRNFASWYRFLLPRLYPRVRAIIAISEFTRERIVTALRVDPGCVHVVPNGVGEAFRPQSPETCASVRAEFGLPDRFVLSLGSLQPRKNLGRLLEAWAALPAAVRAGHVLAVAGGAGAKQVFRSYALTDPPPDVRFLGRVPDAWLPALIAAATAFVYPSYYEGFGLPPLEAMACGTPVITADRTSLPEVVGDAGMMVDPFDVSAIAAAMEKLLEDQSLADALAHRGLQRAGTFTWESTARRTLEVLEAYASR